MVMKISKAVKKLNCEQRVCKFLDNYTKILIVGADNLESNELRNIKKGLSGDDSVVLMGKNTIMKRSLKIYAEKFGNTAFLSLVPLLLGNVGLVFTKGDLEEVSNVFATYKVGTPTHFGLTAPIDVVDPPENSILDPSQTSSFQVLNSLMCFTSLAITYPTLAASPHMFVNAYKNVQAIAAATEYSYTQAEQVKKFLEDPSKFSNNTAKEQKEGSEEEPEEECGLLCLLD